MPSDLDFLADYRVIKKWMGFELTRNPFCVPNPLQESSTSFLGTSQRFKSIPILIISYSLDQVFEANRVKENKSNDDVAIGGIAQQKFRKIYFPKPKRLIRTHGKTVAANDVTNTKQSGFMSESFVLNDEMSNIRQAEFVIMKEEEKHGKHGRDPDGKIMSLMQVK
jgi:hypothetical protein